jgi:hypothetical protein
MSKARDIASAAPAPSTVDATEIGYLDGVTSAIQTQIDAKAPSSTAVTLTGTQTLTNKTLTNPVIASVVNNTLTSTTGDMIYASAANTPARLGIGSSAQVLTVAGGIPSWATPAGGGGMTLISTTTLSNRQTDLTSIPGTYNDLVIIINGANFPTYNTQIELRPNGSTTIVTTDNRQNSGGSNNSNTITGGPLNLSAGYNISLGSSNNTFIVRIHNYASTSYYKAITNFGYLEQSGGTQTAVGAWGGIATTSAITSITLYLGQNVSYNSGQVLLYGVK